MSIETNVNSDIRNFSYQKPREVVASGGFSVEYSRSVNEEALHNDVVSYLAEYRFGLGRYDYPLEFIWDNSGARIVDPVTGESMREKTKRAILEKRARREDSSREEADDEGMGNLANKIAEANVGDSIWWGSLPGRPQDGFGKHAFIYVGQVLRVMWIRNKITNEIEGVKKEIAMSAIRVENPSLLSFNQAHDVLTGQNLNATSPEDFLRNPVVLSGTTKDLLEKEIRKNFVVNGGADEKEWFDGVISDLEPAIRGFMQLVKSGTQEEKLDAFYALEKHADQLKRWRKEGNISSFNPKPTLNELRAAYKNVKLKSPSGLCPITNKSGNIFESSYRALNKALFGEQTTLCCKCPFCDEEVEAVISEGKITCPDCGKSAPWNQKLN